MEEMWVVLTLTESLLLEAAKMQHSIDLKEVFKSSGRQDMHPSINYAPSTAFNHQSLKSTLCQI
jgi:hypothetical protein